MKTGRLFFAQKAIITQDGRLLMIKKAAHAAGNCAHKYDLPGGRMEYGETVDAALKREVLEETGIAAVPGKPFGTFEFYFEKGGERHQVAGIARFCAPVTLDVSKYGQVEADDIADIEWVRFPDIEKLDLIEGIKPLILDIAAYLMKEKEG
ncbi:MAG: NUDIX domain-containing protein [Lactobacillales bacterium]|jgi:8-oxo-dGTP diphosphatase|nr:NUDIX domain-containing protein [Lactobacillales bacterium]